MVEDALIKIEMLCVASGYSHNTVKRRLADGYIPPLDSDRYGRSGWKFSTIERWNPAIARNIAALLAVRLIQFRMRPM